jgi:hypothetical protein
MEMVLHIGQMKSGTTCLQRILANKRVSLRNAGWRYLGSNGKISSTQYTACAVKISFGSAQSKANGLGCLELW